MSNRVWIELEVLNDHTLPAKKREIDHTLNTQRAKLASNMIRRLGVEGIDRVWWNENKTRYCFVIDNGGTYVEASDHGHWFNLDYFGRTGPAVELKTMDELDPPPKLGEGK